MNSLVLSGMRCAHKTRAIGNGESCYQEWKLENSSAFWLEFERLTLNNLREDSNVRKPCLGRVLPSAPNSLQQSKQNFARVDGRDDINLTEDYSRVRLISTGHAESRWTSLRCERRLWRGGCMHHAEALRATDMTSEVRKGNRGRDSQSNVRVSPCRTLRLERCGRRYGPRSPQGGVSVRTVRDWRLGADVVSQRAFLVRKSCRASQLGPIQPLRTAHRGAS